MNKAETIKDRFVAFMEQTNLYESFRPRPHCVSTVLINTATDGLSFEVYF
mgnify:CR=1 FL=1